MTRWAVGIIAVVLILAGFIYGIYEKYDYDFDPADQTYKIVKKWELPPVLDEISGIAWVGDGIIACVQDEDGIIFKYDIMSSKIISQSPFASAGDYEALTLKNKDLWVAESGGTLFRTKRDEINKKDTDTFEMNFTYRNNIEGIAAKPDGNILIAVKDRNLKGDEGDYRSFYTYNPASRELDRDPTIKVNYKDSIFEILHTGNPRMLLRPSDIEYNPVTGDLFVLDAEVPKILVLGSNGRIKKMHMLNPADFFQPEGICFSPSGRIFISNEGKGGIAPNIIEITLN